MLAPGMKPQDITSKFQESNHHTNRDMDKLTYFLACPSNTRLGGVPVNVAIPPVLAAYAMARLIYTYSQ